MKGNSTHPSRGSNKPVNQSRPTHDLTQLVTSESHGRATADYPALEGREEDGGGDTAQDAAEEEDGEGGDEKEGTCCGIGYAEEETEETTAARRRNAWVQISTCFS